MKLTEVERDHLLTLLADAEAEGGYYGNKAQYWKRHERIKAKMLAASGAVSVGADRQIQRGCFGTAASGEVTKKSTPSDFPIMHSRAIRSIPWVVIAPHQRQAEINHGQTLERLAQRDGLSPCEVVAVIEGRAWYRMSDEAADARLLELISL